MKSKMKKKDIKKIEESLTAIEVSDSVLDTARAEIVKVNKERKPSRRFNFKVAVSCVASFVLCLAIILPITLSSLNSKDNSADEPGSSFGGNDTHEPPPSSNVPKLELGKLEQEHIYPDIEDNESSGDSGLKPPEDTDPGAKPPEDTDPGAKPPEDTDPGAKPPEATDPGAKPPEDTTPAIEILSKTKYKDGDTTIITEEKYTVYGCMCVVYILYDVSLSVDVLDQFNNLADVYSVGNIDINYKINAGKYLADTVYNNCRYCFILNSADKSVFEEFCVYLFS